MVGRDQELALVLERWQQAVAGEGQAVLLVGEGGIGKSRLVQNTLDTVAAGENIVLRYQGSPHHTGTALWPVIQQLGIAAGLEPADDGTARLDKVERLLHQGADDIGEAAPLLGALLGLDTGARYPAQVLSPHQQRARTLAILVEQLLGLARNRPVLMLMEDAHWIDPTTLELLGQALDRIAGARVLMLLTSRPDNQPGLGGHPHVTRLTLNRLGRAPTEAIIRSLAGGAELPQAVLDEIASRTDGVPLFVEELTKAVLETGAAGGATAVPVSLHASLMARLDRVPDVKQIAQTAACIGREFSYPLLAEVSSVTETELHQALDRLASAELIFRRGMPPEASYTFKHALVRDAAHESLLKKTRQDLHARIARSLEERFPEIVSSEPELLAQHCVEAGLTEQAVDYWQRAGQQALARSAMAEAVGHLTNGLKVLKRLPEGPEQQRRELGLQLTLGRASIAAKGFAAPETGRAYARARELCSDLGEISEVFPVLYGQSVFHFQRGQLVKANIIARELLRLAEAQGDISAQITGHRMLGSTLCQLGRPVESRVQFEAALALYDPMRDGTSAIIYAIDSRVMCRGWLSHLLLLLGHPEQALAHDAEVPVLSRELGHTNTTAVAHIWGCIFRQLLRDRESALAEAGLALALANEHGFPLYKAAATVVRGWALAEGGQLEVGVEEVRRGIANYAATGAEMWSPYFRGLLAETLAQAGQAEAGLEVLAEALDQVNRIEGRWIEAELHRLRGQLLLRLPGTVPGEAENCFHRALTVSREQGAVLWELRAATSLGKLWRDQGRRPEAYNLIVPIYSRFDGGFDTPDLCKAKAFIAERQG